METKYTPDGEYSWFEMTEEEEAAAQRREEEHRKEIVEQVLAGTYPVGMTDYVILYSTKTYAPLFPVAYAQERKPGDYEYGFALLNCVRQLGLSEIVNHAKNAYNSLKPGDIIYDATLQKTWVLDLGGTFQQI